MEQAQVYKIYEDGTHYDLMFPHNETGFRFWIEEATSARGNILEYNGLGFLDRGIRWICR